MLVWQRKSVLCITGQPSVIEEPKRHQISNSPDSACIHSFDKHVWVPITNHRCSKLWVMRNEWDHPWPQGRHTLDFSTDTWAVVRVWQALCWFRTCFSVSRCLGCVLQGEWTSPRVDGAHGGLGEVGREGDGAAASVWRTVTLWGPLRIPQIEAKCECGWR